MMPTPYRSARRFSWLPWTIAALLVLVLVTFGGCDLPSGTTPPVATRVVVIESPEGLAATSDAMLTRGCVLHSMIADPAGPGVWAVYTCVRVPMERAPVQEAAP